MFELFVGVFEGRTPFTLVEGPSFGFASFCIMGDNGVGLGGAAGVRGEGADSGFFEGDFSTALALL